MHSLVFTGTSYALKLLAHDSSVLSTFWHTGRALSERERSVDPGPAQHNSIIEAVRRTVPLASAQIRSDDVGH